MYNGALSDMRLGTDPWNANRYAFVGGNPITHVELDGHIIDGGNGHTATAKGETLDQYQPREYCDAPAVQDSGGRPFWTRNVDNAVGFWKGAGSDLIETAEATLQLAADGSQPTNPQAISRNIDRAQGLLYLVTHAPTVVNQAVSSCKAMQDSECGGRLTAQILTLIGPLAATKTSTLSKVGALSESGSAGMAAELGAGTERTTAVIGRLKDTAAAKDWAGHEVLDIRYWSIAKNDQWVQSVVDRKMPVYVASPTTWPNLWDAAAGRSTVFGRELQQFTNAGYTWDGWTMVPPGG